MLRPYICARCAIQQRLRLHLQQLQQSRRGFSLVTTYKQNAGYRYSAEEPFPTTVRLRGVERQDSRSPHRPPWRASNASGRPVADGEGRGRYSGQSLQPEQLLTQLDKPAPRRNGSAREREQGASRKPEYLHTGSPLLPPQLKQKVDRFISCGSQGQNDVEAWRILRSIEQEPEAGALRSLGLHKWFVKAVIGFGMRTSRSFLPSAAEREQANAETPRPSDVLRLLPVFHIDATDVWARVLWQVASGIIELQASDPQARADVVLGELMMLWNMAFATRLQRATQKSQTAQGLDWSFLPSAENLAAAIGQRDANSPRMSFDDILGMLLPPVLSNRTSSRFSEDFYDFPSAALVTIDLLRPHTTPSGGPPAHASLPQHVPFLQLMQGIMSMVRHPTLPQALRLKLETPEAGMGYKGVVERLGLASPRVSTVVSGSPLAQPGAGEDVDTALQSSAQQTADSVAPVAASAEIAPRSNPVQDALLEHQRDVGVTPPPPATDAQPIDSPEAVGDDLLAPTLPLEAPDKSRDEVTDRFVNLRINRLGQAMQKQDARLAEHIKTEVFDFASSATNKESLLPDQLYEHLMLALLTLRKPQAAIEVWNHFVQSGRQPTAKTYTVMMRGAQHVRDVNGMEGFWNKMRSAGVQPDIHAWSTRIFGLIKGGKVDFGLRALNDLGLEWIVAAKAKQAAAALKRLAGRRQAKALPEIAPSEAVKLFEGDIGGVPKPNLVAMNAAISALASRNDQHIPKVLAWGRTFGLEPDGTTYNVLLNITMRHGQEDEAIAILKRMAERGIQADSTTWTVLLSAFFEGRVSDDLSPAEQEERVMGFITGLEAATASAIDQKGYALIIDRLLKVYDNPRAASTVLAHMTAQGLQPTVHIYTILMASYFQRQPPDFAAADALWKQIQAADGGRGATMDAVFYDRMIEGYAMHHWAVGSTQPLLSFLQRLEESGQRPSWRALHFAARALHERGDINRLLQIVDQAREWVRRDGDGGRGPTSQMLVGQRSYGQRDFWMFVIETGLLREEGLERPEQVMREKTGESPVTRRIGGMV
ncbi:hypothetical protein LTR85_003883 [Meristemomyces frigidus]|nr:hypothetical protein LTR85_003883 [Meristemomyces frigidus]